MESGSGGEGNGDRLAAELARVREAIDDLRRRPIPLDADTLRHVVTASLAEASAPPPNLLVTAIRRLDRVDARLESIEALLGGPAGLPRGGSPASAAGRGRVAAIAPAPAPAPVGYTPPPDPEAIADALARRLVGVLSSPTPLGSGGGAGVDDLLAALRPLVPEAARTVLRRSGREPSPQAVEVLQQTALSAIDEAVDRLGRFAPPSAPYAPPADPRRLAGPAGPGGSTGPRPALAPAPPAPTPPVNVEALAGAISARVTAALAGELRRGAGPPPMPPPIDLEALTGAITARVTAALAGELRQGPGPVAEPVRPPPGRSEPPPPVDPALVAEAVISRLTEQPPPQAVLSAMAMAPLLSAVGNVEAAVARIAEPDTSVVVVLGRLQAGIEALIHALDEDRAGQAQMRQGFAEVTELARAELSSLSRAAAEAEVVPPDGDLTGDPGPAAAEGDVAAPGFEGVRAAVSGLQRRLDRLGRELAPLTEGELATSAPGLVAQGQRLERSMGHILTALAAVAEHLQEQSTIWHNRFDELRAAVPSLDPAGPAEAAHRPDELADLARRIDQLVAGTAADRQRFQRLGGTIDGLAELLGQVSERLDRLPRALARPLPADSGVEPPVAADALGTATSPAPALFGDHELRDVSLVGSGEPAALPAPQLAVREQEVDQPATRAPAATESPEDGDEVAERRVEGAPSDELPARVATDRGGEAGAPTGELPTAAEPVPTAPGPDPSESPEGEAARRATATQERVVAPLSDASLPDLVPGGAVAPGAGSHGDGVDDGDGSGLVDAGGAGPEVAVPSPETVEESRRRRRRGRRRKRWT